MAEVTQRSDAPPKIITMESESVNDAVDKTAPVSSSKTSGAEPVTTALPSLASSSSTASSSTTPATTNATPAVVTSLPSDSATTNASPVYIFIDFRSNEEYNPNKVDFNGASYMIVDTPEFNIIRRKDFNFKTPQNEPADAADAQTTTFQDFIQDLSDSIHTYCIVKEKPLTFVSGRGWDLRLKFIKHAKDVGAQLPNYLEYPRYFDLKKEFMKYEELNQMAEFNSIDYSSLTLNSIKEALKIDSATESDSNVDLMLGIVKKIFEANTSPYIFKKPHDMNLDLSHFFIEKSRIIYMTNLPSDTTQSEMESWFNQFNGRAIAFWSIKNPTFVSQVNPQANDSSNSSYNNNSMAEPVKTCSGFAIFASHEDAIEALSMNGQTLNDRLIELQPSSVRVLDKAQDILSPFPSSKNKPRPGDWTCPSCGFSNFQRRTACFRCSFPAASAAAVQESIYANGTSSNGSSINLQNKGYNNMSSNNGNHNMNNSGSNSMNYNSNTNHYNNYNNYNSNSNNYNINNKNEANGNSYNMSMSAGNNGNSIGNNNTNGSNNNNNGNGNSNNSNSGYSSRQCSNVPFRAGDWKCLNETCAYHNFAKNVCCLKCGAPRVQSAIINGHAHNQHRNNSDNNSMNGSVINNGSNNNNSHHHNGNHNHHHNNGKNALNHNNQHIMSSNFSSRSNSLPSHMNPQFNQNLNSQHFNNDQYMQNQNQGQQQSNYNKFKSSTSDLYNMEMGNRSNLISSVPGTPTITSTRGNSGYTSNNPSNLNMASNQVLKGDNTTYDLASRIGGLSLNHTGASGSSSVSGTSGINSMLNLNIPNLNLSNMGLNSLSNNMNSMNNIPINMNMNMNMNMNNLGGIGGMNNLNNVGNMNGSGLNGLNGLEGLNGLNVLNGLNNLNGLSNLGRTLSSPIVSGSPAVGGGSSAGTGFTSIGNIDRSSGMGGEESVTGSSFVESNGN